MVRGNQPTHSFVKRSTPRRGHVWSRRRTDSASLVCHLNRVQSKALNLPFYLPANLFSCNDNPTFCRYFASSLQFSSPGGAVRLLLHIRFLSGLMTQTTVIQPQKSLRKILWKQSICRTIFTQLSVISPCGISLKESFFFSR